MQIVFHWQAVLLAALVGVAVPGLWYSPLAFFKTWLRLSGMDESTFRAGGGPMIGLGLSVLAALLGALTLDGFFAFTGSNDFQMGALAALQLYLGLVLPGLAVEHAYNKKPWALFGLNLVPGLLNAALMGGLIASMR
jgi:hypothetical protein